MLKQMEIYYVLKIDGGIYLPTVMDANNKYVQNVMWLNQFRYSKNIK